MFSCCVFWVCVCFVLCVCWSRLGVALVLLYLVCFVCVSFLFRCACFFLSLMKITVFLANLAFLGLMLIQSLFLILVSGSCFLLLFCLFLVSRCPFVSFMLVVLFWLKHKIRFVLICMLFSCSVLWVLGFVPSVLGLVD